MSQKKNKTESSRMTLMEYVFFSKRKTPEMNRAIKIREAAVNVSGESVGFKKGSGIRSQSKTPYVTPEFWEKAFQQIENEN